ncbi:MAG: DUF4222 domain-containing protein [Bacteroidales bacterium]|nr:DUF4222 domain-containing protein [Bacteroidales bacterium]
MKSKSNEEVTFTRNGGDRPCFRKLRKFKKHGCSVKH